MSRGRCINRFDWGSRVQEACEEASISTDLTGDLDLSFELRPYAVADWVIQLDDFVISAENKVARLW